MMVGRRKLSQILCALCGAMVTMVAAATAPQILVVGSINADFFIPVDRLPVSGENIVAKESDDAGRAIAGGKGANTAVAARRLGCDTSFCCMFGDDAHADMLRQTLADNHVDTSLCQTVRKPSGQGLVFLQDSGAVSAVVLGGANAAWPAATFDADALLTGQLAKHQLACVMLQMEVPMWVNERVAEAAERAGIPVFQDVGGAEQELSAAHLQRCTYLSPNLSELARLSKLPVATEEEVAAAARELQRRGARNVLVTLGDRGSVLYAEDGRVLTQPCCAVDKVVDETGAGDNFRAGFCVRHFAERQGLQESMAFAAAAGAVAVTKLGAIPSCATREECLALVAKHAAAQVNLRGGATGAGATPFGAAKNAAGGEPFPFKFASRLNSMKDRLDLWDGSNDVRGWILRQGKVKGLDLVDFNYPQHITSPTVTEEAKRAITSALDEAGLKTGAICLRFPKDMQLGAYTHPKADVRARAVALTKEACAWAQALGADEVVVWSAFDGYDYAFQTDYDVLYARVVAAFQEVCDAYPDVKVSLEYKPTDENTRFFAVPSTGAACLLMRDVDRPNFGLTLDFGHCLMAGENPAQSVAMVGQESRRWASLSQGPGPGRRSATGRDLEDGFAPAPMATNKLFGVQLGDGYGRLGAEDGLAFGSVHPTAALEFVLWLIKTDYRGHIYFDTFPRNEDPVREAEFNIRQFKSMYFRAKAMLEEDGGMERYWASHDAMGVLEEKVYRYLS